MSERGQARRTRHLAFSRPSVRRKRHESAMNSVIGRGRGTALLPPGTGESQEGCVLCPFAFTEHTRCASRGHYTSKSARWLFLRRPADLEDLEQEDLAAFRLLHPSLNTAYGLVQDFLQMMRKREGERLDDWLRRVHESRLPELQSFAHGVEEDYDAVKAGLTLSLNNGQVEGQVTKIKLIKRMMYDIVGELEVTSMLQSPYQEASAC